MRNSEKRSTSVPRETNGQEETTRENFTVTSVMLSTLLKAKICSRNSKKAIYKIASGTDSYRLGTSTPMFGTRFHH